MKSGQFAWMLGGMSPWNATGVDQGDGGGVICCDGMKVSCSWQASWGDQETDAIIKMCTIRHENDHWDVIEDCPCDGLSRAKTKKGTDMKKEECSAYRVTLDCLSEKRKSCRTKKCVDDIDYAAQQYKNAANSKYGCLF